MDKQDRVDVIMELHIEKTPDGWRSFSIKIGDTVIYRADKTGDEMWHPYISPSLEDFRQVRNDFWRTFPPGVINDVGVASITVDNSKIKLMRSPGLGGTL